MQGSKKHSLIIGRETLMLPLPILIQFFGYHPVSGDGFPILPLCREWIKKSYPHRQDVPIHSLGRGLSTHPCLPNGHTINNSMLVRQQRCKLEAPKISHGLRLLLGLGKSPGSREISQTLRRDFTFSHHQQGSIDFDTDNTNCPAGMFS